MSEQLCFDVLFNDPIKAKGGYGDMYDMYTRIFMCEVWKYVFILLFYSEIHATFLCVVVDEK